MCPTPYLASSRYAALYFVFFIIDSLLFIAVSLFIIEYIFGWSNFIWTVPGVVDAADVAIYQTTLSISEYSRTLRYGFDFWVFVSCMFSFATYSVNLILDMIGYQSRETYVITTLGFIFQIVPDIVRFGYYSYLLIWNQWMVKAWFGPFIVCYVCAFARLLIDAANIFSACILGGAGKRQKIAEINAGIQKPYKLNGE
jgi:hypothetical protein